MKLTATAAILFAATSSTALAADCGWGQTEYQIHWTSFAMHDADPSGRPTRAYAFASDKGHNRADPIEVHFQYGMARRFQFDSPKVVETTGSPSGAMVIAQNLLEPQESTQTYFLFEKPVSNLRIELYDIDDNAKFGRSFRDQVAFVGRTGHGQTVTPDVSLLGFANYEAKAYLSYEQDRGFSGSNIYPLAISSAVRDEFAPFEITFDGPIKDVTMDFASVNGPGSAHSFSSDPSPQEIMLGKTTFCVES